MQPIPCQHFAERGPQNSQHACVQSLLVLAIGWPFSKRPIEAKCWAGRIGKILKNVWEKKNRIYLNILAIPAIMTSV